MSMFIELLKEPKIEFGEDFLSDDPKMGISAGGFHSLSTNTHRSEIHFSTIGTSTNIESAIEWIKKFNSPIEATGERIEIKSEAEIIDGEVFDMTDEESLFHEMGIEAYENLKKRLAEKEDSTEVYDEVNKKLNPDFPGFNEESAFRCKFLNDESNNRIIKEVEIKEILSSEELSLFDKVVRICDLYINEYKFLLKKVSLDRMYVS
jgi:hypothetical protein